MPCVYILASQRNGTLYIGVRSDLPNRVSLHKQDLIEGFTKKHREHLLVYYEMHPTMEAASPAREATQGMAPAVEDQAHREYEPGVD